MGRARQFSSRTTTNVLLRGIDRELVGVFKARADRNGRSLQSELRLTLRRAAHGNFDEALQTSEHWHARLDGRSCNDAKTMIDADRRR